MKKLFYLSFLFFALGFTEDAKGQVHVSVNIGNQPLWGPVGYDYVRFYYMPEIDVYYDVVHRRYTYFQGNRWVTRSKLPGRYKNFNHYRTYKVVLNESSPWKHHRHHRSQYGTYAKYRSQKVWRDVDRRYVHYDNKKHKEHHKHDKKKKNKRRH